MMPWCSRYIRFVISDAQAVSGLSKIDACYDWAEPQFPWLWGWKCDNRHSVTLRHLLKEWKMYQSMIDVQLLEAE